MVSLLGSGIERRDLQLSGAFLNRLHVPPDGQHVEKSTEQHPQQHSEEDEDSYRRMVALIFGAKHTTKDTPSSAQLKLRSY